MQRAEEKASQQTVLQLMDEHVSHIDVAGTELMQFHFHDAASAELTAVHLNNYLRRFSFWGEIRVNVKYAGCHELLLNKQQIDELWGQNSYVTLREVYQLNLDLVEKLLKEAIANPILYQMCVRVRMNSTLWNILHCFLRYHLPEVCRKLIDCLSDHTLNRLMTLEGYQDWCPFSTALFYQSPDICVKLINRMSTDVLDSTLSMRVGPWSTIIMAASNQTDISFVSLVKKVSPFSLAHSVNLLRLKDNRSTFEIASQYQSADAFQIFLQQLLKEDAKTVINGFFKLNPDKLFSCFYSIALYQTVQNCGRFLSLLNDESMKILAEKVQNGIDSSMVRFALRAALYKLNQHSGCLQELKSEGDAIFPHELLKKLLCPLFKYDGEKWVEEKKPLPNRSERDEKALSLFSRGVFVKIIRTDQENNNPAFVEHLFNPSIRQVVRKSDKAKKGYKLLLNPGLPEKKESLTKENRQKVETKRTDATKINLRAEEKPAAVCSAAGGLFPIIRARNMEARVQHKKLKKKKKPLADSTKHPVTYVSVNLHTALFGSVGMREMVGYAFTVNQRKIKFLSTQDCGTYQRWWYHTDINYLLGQANHAYHFVCKSFTEFVSRVDDQPYVVNEALVKLNQQDLFAIVIARDTEKAREIAIQRRLHLISTYKRDLPILFYDPEKRQTKAYSSSEQRQDHPALCLLILKATIRQQNSLFGYIKGFFGRRIDRIHFAIDDQDYSINVIQGNKILEIITANVAKDVLKIAAGSYTKADNADASRAAYKAILKIVHPPLVSEKSSKLEMKA